MAQKTNDNDELIEKNKDNSNKSANISQIILQYELIYLFKIAVFVIIFVTILYNLHIIENWKSSDLVSTFTFILSAGIDCVVLSKNIKIKGNIVNILLIYLILLFCGGIFVCIALWGYINFTNIYRKIVYIVNLLCCLSPFIEIIMDIAIRLQSEKDNNI